MLIQYASVEIQEFESKMIVYFEVLSSQIETFLKADKKKEARKKLRELQKQFKGFTPFEVYKALFFQNEQSREILFS